MGTRPWQQLRLWNAPYNERAQAEDPPLPEGYRPLVSVVVPTFNRARYLRRTIDSILTQDYDQIECIVVDGASSDGSIDVLREYGDRITWISEPDRGPFDAINKGWAMAHGEILAWLNADDLYMPGAVRHVVGAFARNPTADVVHGATASTDASGRTQFIMAAPHWDLQIAWEHCEHVIYQASAFMRREAVERAGGDVYPEWSHDYDLWFRIALTGGRFMETTRLLAAARGEQPENARGLPARYAPAMVSMVKRLSARPDLPPELAAKRRRALSNAYARVVRYADLRYPAHWKWLGRYLALAMITDPSNTVGIMRDCAIILPWRHRGLERAEGGARATARGVRTAGRLLASPRPWAPATIALAAAALQAWRLRRAVERETAAAGPDNGSPSRASTSTAAD